LCFISAPLSRMESCVTVKNDLPGTTGTSNSEDPFDSSAVQFGPAPTDTIGSSVPVDGATGATSDPAAKSLSDPHRSSAAAAAEIQLPPIEVWSCGGGSLLPESFVYDATTTVSNLVNVIIAHGAIDVPENGHVVFLYGDQQLLNRNLLHVTLRSTLMSGPSDIPDQNQPVVLQAVVSPVPLEAPKSQGFSEELQSAIGARRAELDRRHSIEGDEYRGHAGTPHISVQTVQRWVLELEALQRQKEYTRSADGQWTRRP